MGGGCIDKVMKHETFFQDVPEHEHKFIPAEKTDEGLVMRCRRTGCTEAYTKR